ncbi:helix-turn-helix domain-containing protein, partial [Enterobacter cloacae complex sp.6701062]|uniref:helix-turn-helix domain-containing protein n=1 Tax=Enterobacter cloacae complex sp.6701062 TaxID=3397177 RepID=UPI003AABA086
LERVKELAKRKGWSLRKVEEEAGISAKSLYNWNKYKPNATNLEKVAKALNVSVDYLMDDAANPVPLLTQRESFILLAFNTQVSIEGNVDFDDVTLKVTVT